MRKSRFTEQQIIRLLEEAEAGRRVIDLRRERGFANGRFTPWKATCRGL